MKQQAVLQLAYFFFILKARQNQPKPKDSISVQIPEDNTTGMIQPRPPQPSCSSICEITDTNEPDNESSTQECHQAHEYLSSDTDTDDDELANVKCINKIKN